MSRPNDGELIDSPCEPSSFSEVSSLDAQMVFFLVPSGMSESLTCASFAD